MKKMKHILMGFLIVGICICARPVHAAWAWKTWFDFMQSLGLVPTYLSLKDQNKQAVDTQDAMVQLVALFGGASESEGDDGSDAEGEVSRSVEHYTQGTFADGGASGKNGGFKKILTEKDLLPSVPSQVSSVLNANGSFDEVRASAESLVFSGDGADVDPGCTLSVVECTRERQTVLLLNELSAASAAADKVLSMTVKGDETVEGWRASLEAQNNIPGVLKVLGKIAGHTQQKIPDLIGLEAQGLSIDAMKNIVNTGSSRYGNTE